MATINERIEALEAKLKEEKAKKQRIEARKRAIEARAERAKDTRRKILIGSVILAQVKQGKVTEAGLHAMLGSSLTRDDDRALFNLPPMKTTPLQAGGVDGGVSTPP